MGCGGSRELNSRPRAGSDGPLTLQEIEARIDAPVDAKLLQFKDFSMRYAFVSQRGYYPDAPTKLNQDSLRIIEKYGGVEDQAFFGVFDGHGKFGTECATFVRKELPKVLLNVMEKRPGKQLTDNITAAHVNTNTMLHLDSRIDDSLSGTTSITIIFQGRKMIVSNVGDSRAIVISRTEKDDGNGNRLVARALSSDHTPYRQEERDRIKSHGGRIMSMDQIEGIEPYHENWGNITLGDEIDEGGDPPRVWAATGAYPGTAFTRSFGDIYAEELGVYAEPEFLVRDIQPDDLYVVIASDGIFEFITNQALATIIDHHDDPLEACRHAVEQAYGLWLQYEVRTDDITIICIYLQGHEHLPKSDETSVKVTKRPVRRNISREKKKYVIEAEKKDGSGDMTPQEVRKLMLALKSPKTKMEETTILNAISENFLFRHLNESQLNSLVEVIQRVNVKSGDVVIKQGDYGDLFYVAQTGVYEVYVSFPDSDDPPPGTKVHVYEPDDSYHPCFGELALMYDKPRAATIVAKEGGLLWALDRNVFRHVVLRTQGIRNLIIKTLRNVKLFESLSPVQIQRLADLMVTSVYNDGEYVITQGDVGDCFYIVLEGTCLVSINNPEGSEEKEKVVGKLQDNDYFGERALLSSDPRAANIISSGRTELLVVTKEVFEEVLGPLASIMEANQRKLEKLAADRKNNAPGEFSDIELVGVTSIFPQGSIVLGKFNSELVNVTAKTFVLSNTEEKFLQAHISNSYEALKLINSTDANANVFIPRLLSCYREPNAFHFVYERRIVTDIGQVGPLATCPDIADVDTAVPYAGACIVSALEALHSLNILYRSVHPEAVHIDLVGRICLLDLTMSKIGAVDNKTLTMCGIPEYLAPEQISQQGHNGAVDFWALGVLLYELIEGDNPFAVERGGEVAVFSKISSLGSSAFPALSFDDKKFSPSAIDLINKLVKSNPDERLGMGKMGFSAIKEHPYFSHIEWNPDLLSKMPSPFETLAKLRVEDAIEAGCPNDIVSSWKERNSNDFKWLSDYVA